jgi:hypothetical protein
MIPLYVIYKKGKLLFKQASFPAHSFTFQKKRPCYKNKNPIEKALEIKILDIYKCLIYQ